MSDPNDDADQSMGDSIIRDTTARIFADLADPQALNAAPNDRWKAPLWQALEEAGLTLAWVSEENGGAGADLADGFDILRVSGQYAAPVAIAETLLAGYFLDVAGIKCPSGPLTVAPVRLGDTLTCDDNGTISGIARAVPHVRDARAIVVIAEREADQVIALMAPGALGIADRQADMGGERADVTFDNVYPVEMAPVPEGWHADTANLFGAAVRAVQMTGALESVLELSVQYAGERVAFGRPIGKFQAVQHNLARLGGEVAAALAASGSAADTLARSTEFNEALLLEIASAKIRVGEAANDGAAIAHQVHGAIGWTAEHVLQRYTRRLWGWRDDFGAESHWAVMLGDMVTEAGADALWPMIAAR
ncbi:MAG TPA: acyl-CoA dehydrogenase family protein [Thermohalobaculum sp.]|nr:acyl-CoA dehydrogenase family protein [Thermohalobaculum sp.]